MAEAATTESEWTEHKAEDGRLYYWNAALRKSVWEKPDGFQPKPQAATSMEVEDSEGGGEDGGEFRPVVKVRRRKAKEEINVGDGGNDGDVEKLLSNNKFSPLAEESNNINNANPGAEKTIPVVPATGKSAGEKKQPPLVVKEMSFARLAKVMSSCDVQPEHKLTRYGTKITCFSSDDFDAVQAHLKKNKVQFYTHGKRRARPGSNTSSPKRGTGLHQGPALRRNIYWTPWQQLPSIEETPFIVLFPELEYENEEASRRTVNCLQLPWTKCTHFKKLSTVTVVLKALSSGAASTEG